MHPYICVHAQMHACVYVCAGVNGTRFARTRTENLRAKAGVADISKKIGEARLRRLGHYRERLGRCGNETMEVSGHRNIRDQN